MEAENIILEHPAESASARALREDLEDPDLLAGVRDGRWTIIQWADPFLTVEFRVGEDGTSTMGIRLDASDYPTRAPSGVPWDVPAGAPLPPSLWPRGPLADTVFRQDWSVSMNGSPYCAWDRIALESHTEWPATMPGKIWHPGRTVLHYLRETSHILESATLSEQTP